MAAVTICSDFGAQEYKVCHFSTVFPSICHVVIGPDDMILFLFFWMFSFKPAFSLSSFTFIKRLFSCSSNLIPACASSSLIFHLMYSAYRLNKQCDNMKPWCTAFSFWNQSVVPYLVLAVASWPAYRFLRRQVRRYGSPISLSIFHSLLWSTQSKALA